jgi:hypothetical protein
MSEILGGSVYWQGDAYAYLHDVLQRMVDGHPVTPANCLATALHPG